MEIRVQLSRKQETAFNYLIDNETTELFYGGGAGGGKSFLGCFWLVYCCLKYPGTRYLLGRAKLKTLKESTLLTLFNVIKIFNLKRDKDWTMNMMEGAIHFRNESSIYLKDLFLYPTDPEFDSLGSTEYTGAFVDEVSEITKKAKDIVASRIRYKLDEYQLIPKLLLASNPSKGWAYQDFYRPAIENRLLNHRKFVPALVGDNPFMTIHYQENLLKLNEKSKQRLLYGNWEYDDDPSSLFEYNDILYLFENALIEQGKNYYISCDVARLGDDKTVICVWRGLVIIELIERSKQTTDQTERDIRSLMIKYNVPLSNVVVDEDGLGGGVVDHLKCAGFVNNSRAYNPISINKQQLIKYNYANLKTQCYFKLSQLVKERAISIKCNLSTEVKERLFR